MRTAEYPSKNERTARRRRSLRVGGGAQPQFLPRLLQEGARRLPHLLLPCPRALRRAILPNKMLPAGRVLDLLGGEVPRPRPFRRVVARAAARHGPLSGGQASSGWRSGRSPRSRPCRSVPARRCFDGYSTYHSLCTARTAHQLSALRLRHARDGPHTRHAAPHNILIVRLLQAPRQG